MDELLPIILVLSWALISWLGNKAKKKGQRQESESAEPSAVEQFLQQISREAGLAPEQPPPPPPPPVPIRVAVPRPPGTGSEHRVTASEHRPSASEHRPSASEHRPSASEHRPSASEHRPSASEHRPSASEHRHTTSEHIPGDAALPAIPRRGSDQPRRRSKLGAALAADLHGGRETLSRAVVLREILGPPVSLRSRDEGS